MKKLFKLSLILLGLIMCFGATKVQAGEIISAFTNQKLTRSTLQTTSKSDTLTAYQINRILGISKDRESGSYYQWNINTDDEAKTVWKIATYSSESSNLRDYTDLYYCLNATRGFGVINNEMAEGAKDTYVNSYDMKDTTLKTYIANYAGGNLGTNYNKVLWILDNSYIPTVETNYQSSDEYKSLMEKANITIDNNELQNLTEDDIEVVQQMAIWYFTNSDNSKYNNSNLPSLYLNGSQLSSMRLETDEYGSQITGAQRQRKAEKLYSYFINNASEIYVNVVPSLEISNTNVTVTESGSNYIVGPFSLIGENTTEIKEIIANVNKSYKLLDSSKKEVKGNDFTKVIGGNFYLQIAKAEVTEDTQIQVNLTYKYDIKKLTFITDTSDPTNTQPVVLVGKEEKSSSINTNANIELIEKIVKKVWEDNNNQDGKRPTNVKVQLYKGNVKYGEPVELTTGSDKIWQESELTYTWTKLLEKEDGKQVIYTIKEIDESGNKVEDNGNYNDNYTVKYGEEEGKVIITNTYLPEKTQISGTKTWQDNENQDGKRPEQIIVNLVADGEKVDSKIVTQEDDWKYSFTNLNKYKDGKEIVYTIDEEIVPEYTTTIDGYDITNKYTPGKITKIVVKEWKDNNNQDDIRPTSVQVQLYKTVNGIKTSMGEEYKIILNQENNWTYTWKELSEKENGEKITYSVEETEVDQYTVSYSAENYDNVDKITITNTHIPEEITGLYNIKLTKVDEEGNLLVGAKFKVTDQAGTNKEVDLTSQASVYLSQNIELNSVGEMLIRYSIEETIAPNGYEPITKTDIYIKATVIENNDKYEISAIELIDEEGKAVTVRDNLITVNEENNTVEIKVKNTPIQKKFDLSLRKFITKVNDIEYSRIPVVDTSTIASTGTATYKHTKEPIAVQKGDVVTYTIRVYNEGEVDGYVEMITDHLPDNLIPITIGTEGIDEEKYAEEIEFNTNWGWINSEDGKTVTTTITSKSNADTYSVLTNLEEVTDTKLNAYVEGSDKLDYINVEIKCLVTDNAVSGEYLTNIAEISKMCDVDGVEVQTDRDSTKANADYSNLADYKNEEAISSTEESYVEGQEDDDDFEKLVVKEFDLALRKFITKVNETSYSRVPVVDTLKLGTKVDGKVITTATYNHTKEPVIVETDDLVTYTIRIYNEGTLDGFANEITDDIPEGLEFLPNSDINVSYRWRMLDQDGNETYDVSKAVMIVTDYLSDIDKNNIINAVSEVEGIKTLSYKDVQVQFKVVAKAEKLKDNIIINEAQISNDSDIDIDSIPNRNEKYDYDFGNNEDDIDYEPIKLQYFDLALRKFITKVNTVDYNNRYPEIQYNEDGSIIYNHTKNPVLVTTDDMVVYTIRVYNEGEKSGYATEIIDNLPEGLEFIPDNEINKQYGWKLLDSKGNITEEMDKAIKVSTDYLKNEIIAPLIEENGQKILSYKDVQIAFKVIEPNTSDRILVNIAEISKDSDDDIDSIPGNDVLTEDDIDREYVKVQYFDLSLKKWVTKTLVTYNGKTTTTKTGFTEDSEGIAKVDLVASKMTKTIVKFVYSIKVTNEGELPGYAYEVKDYIPKGLKFVAADNKDWKELEDGTVVTDKLKDTLLNPGESATVEIVLTWKNSTTNLGLKTNYAEISKDSSDDIDSTPDNFNKQEDDIDDAQVILSIKTAGAPTYIGLIFTTIAILAGGIFLIKKYVIK